MSPIATSALPLLPLDAGVVLPGMTITLALETPEARAAAEAATGAGNRLVLVPRLGRTSGPDASSGRFARVGTVAQVERTGALPGGTPAVVVQALERATIGAATAAAGPALWVNVEIVEEPRGHRGRRRGGPRAAGRLRGHRRAPRHRPPRRRPARRDRSRPPGRHGRLLAGAVGRAQGRAARDPRSRPAGSSWSWPGAARPWPSWSSRIGSARTWPKAWSAPSASTCCASSWRPSARSSASRATARTATTTGPGWRR